jgi:hypothetical protein
MHGALGLGDVLRDLDAGDRRGDCRRERLVHAPDPRGGAGRQLPGRLGVAERVRALAKEAEATARGMETRTQPVAALR